jgi:hypothetical protein
MRWFVRFKAWCSLMFGISSFSEGKIVDRVFIPLNGEESCYLDELMQSCRGFITTSNGEKGVTFTKKGYLCLERNLAVKFEYLNEDVFNAKKFENFIASYFNKLGFDFYGKKQYRMPPCIHIKINNEVAKQQFIQQFSKYNPCASYDPLTNNNTIQMPARFLKHLYANYYKQAAFKPVTNLTYLQERKLQLSKVLRQIEKGSLNKNLTYARRLALDYDNDDFNITEACSTYAQSLKIYAQLYKESISADDFRSLYAAANLLAAYDRNGKLKQSLNTDAIFILYLTIGLYNDALVAQNCKKPGFLIANLVKDKSDQIFAAIAKNAEQLLHGDSKVQADKNLYFVAKRFLPDINNHSDTDEIIFQAGGMRGHSALFRLIKVPMLENGHKAAPNENPAYFDYYKVENNLGAGCNQADKSINTCLGTYVTKIQPYIRDSNKELVSFPHTALSHPQEYQAAMEETLKELINVERQLLFYKEPSVIKDSRRYSPLTSEEGKEWKRLQQLQQVLKGRPYEGKLSYFAQDVLNPAFDYECFVENQKDYMQNGGSCLIFSIKGLLKSVLGQELATLHTHFMQQNDAFDCVNALKRSIERNNQKIEKLSPVFIYGSRMEVNNWVKEFKVFLKERNCLVQGLEVAHTKYHDQSTLILRQPYLKKHWFVFMSNWQAQKENRVNPNFFFKQAPNLSLPSNFQSFKGEESLSKLSIC